MLCVIIIIFFVAIISLFGMVMFRAWKLSKQATENSLEEKNIIPQIYFRRVEKIVLYLAKRLVQTIVLVSVKYSFTAWLKVKKWASDKLPKAYKFLKKQEEIEFSKNSFLRRAIIESKIKIRNIKEKVRREHEKNNLPK